MKKIVALPREDDLLIIIINLFIIANGWKQPKHYQLTEE